MEIALTGATGFLFRFETIEHALRDVMSNFSKESSELFETQVFLLDRASICVINI